MKTTINIRIDILEQINKAAKIKGISRAELIFALITKVSDEIQNPESIGNLVQYQKRSKPQNWHAFHIQVREDMYEYWLDMRKLLKKSVSLILAYAVKKYLCKVMKTKYSDNNLRKNYIIIKKAVNSIIIWKFIWGFPLNPEDLNN